ncbi:hypothetical protein [Streptomyces himalayensis]|uniref:hypothetical protein n=1 Tax=Streptomyces himalayensis TaxID=2820085 RepID=UPI002868284D|nr:hypothetical protein [Streptomyces himalayensis]
MRATDPEAEAGAVGVLGDAGVAEVGSVVFGVPAVLGVPGDEVVSGFGAVVFGVLGDVVAGDSGAEVFGTEVFGAEVFGAEVFAVPGGAVRVFDPVELFSRSQLRAQRCQSASVPRCWRDAVFSALWN